MATGSVVIVQYKKVVGSNPGPTCKKTKSPRGNGVLYRVLASNAAGLGSIPLRPNGLSPLGHEGKEQ